MSKKVRVTPELIKKAEEVFAKAGQKMIVAGQGLSRRELRALERKGIVSRMVTRQASKYVGETGAIIYAYRLIGVLEGVNVKR